MTWNSQLSNGQMKVKLISALMGKECLTFEYYLVYDAYEQYDGFMG